MRGREEIRISHSSWGACDQSCDDCSRISRASSPPEASMGELMYLFPHLSTPTCQHSRELAVSRSSDWFSRQWWLFKQYYPRGGASPIPPFRIKQREGFTCASEKKVSKFHSDTMQNPPRQIVGDCGWVLRQGNHAKITPYAVSRQNLLEPIVVVGPGISAQPGTLNQTRSCREHQLN